MTDAFSATYDNYLITLTGGAGSASTDLKLELGATVTNYYYNLINMQPTSNSVSGASGLNTTSFRDVGAASTNMLDAQIRLFSPYLSQRTMMGATSVQSTNNKWQTWASGYVDNTTSYTAFTLSPGSGTITGGIIRVYGYQNS